MCLKDAAEMANIVDSDQTGLSCYLLLISICQGI